MPVRQIVPQPGENRWVIASAKKQGENLWNTVHLLSADPETEEGSALVGKLDASFYPISGPALDVCRGQPPFVNPFAERSHVSSVALSADGSTILTANPWRRSLTRYNAEGSSIGDTSTPVPDYLSPLIDACPEEIDKGFPHNTASRQRWFRKWTPTAGVFSFATNEGDFFLRGIYQAKNGPDRYDWALEILDANLKNLAWTKTNESVPIVARGDTFIGWSYRYPDPDLAWRRITDFYEYRLRPKRIATATDDEGLRAWNARRVIRVEQADRPLATPDVAALGLKETFGGNAYRVSLEGCHGKFMDQLVALLYAKNLTHLNLIVYPAEPISEGEVPALLKARVYPLWWELLDRGIASTLRAAKDEDSAQDYPTFPDEISYHRATN